MSFACAGDDGSRDARHPRTTRASSRLGPPGGRPRDQATGGAKYKNSNRHPTDDSFRREGRASTESRRIRSVSDAEDGPLRRREMDDSAEDGQDGDQRVGAGFDKGRSLVVMR